MTLSIPGLVRELALIRLDNVFNPYSDQCPIHDLADGPARRRRNLKKALKAATESNVQSIWIARDLGYRGGRRTGLALTDDVHLEAYAARHSNITLQRATKGPNVGETTAATIWRVLCGVAEPVFLWNVFPFHPHETGNAFSNRCHTATELRQCEYILYEVLAITRPRKILAIGNHAGNALSRRGIDCFRVRHPSYGGQNVFVDQVQGIYGTRLPR